jgi:hypothetical protein
MVRRECDVSGVLALALGGGNAGRLDGTSPRPRTTVTSAFGWRRAGAAHGIQRDTGIELSSSTAVDDPGRNGGAACVFATIRRRPRTGRTT